jgi:hypothetical protein
MQHSIPANRAPTFAKPRPLRHAFTPISRATSRARCVVDLPESCWRRSGSSYWKDEFMREKKPPRNMPPAAAMADLATQLSVLAAKKSWYFFCCWSVARSASVHPGGSGSCPGGYTGAVIGSCPKYIAAESTRPWWRAPPARFSKFRDLRLPLAAGPLSDVIQAPHYSLTTTATSHSYIVRASLQAQHTFTPKTADVLVLSHFSGCWLPPDTPQLLPVAPDRVVSLHYLSYAMV